MSRIILFGATGYTGDLTARSLVRQGAAPVLAARNPKRVAALADELGGLEHAVADVTDPASLRALVEPGDVLISTVGPFVHHGRTAVQTAAEVGAHYLDSTGEGPFIREVFEHWGPVAAGNGAALLPAFGFDYVPGVLAGAIALEEAGSDATRVDIGYFTHGTAGSGGTNASAAQVLLRDGYGYRGGRLRAEPVANQVLHFELGGNSRTAVTVPASEHFALPTSHPQLRDVRVGVGRPPTSAHVASIVSRGLRPVLKVPGARAALLGVAERLVTGSSGGPDASARASSSCTVVARAHARGGEMRSRVVLHGPDPYDFTADILAWGAAAAHAGQLLDTGAVGPTAAFGRPLLEQGCATAGMARATQNS